MLAGASRLVRLTPSRHRRPGGTSDQSSSRNRSRVRRTNPIDPRSEPPPTESLPAGLAVPDARSSPESLDRRHSGVLATPARIGFRSTYTLHARTAPSSRSFCDLKRPSQKRPEHVSSLFARRAIGSHKQRMNHDRLLNRLRRSDKTCSSAVSMFSSWGLGSAG